ncbi:MAG: glycoside hydrolase family 127 protein [Firmicutes bacterium]|nr:glycoside hydrolase family 127 protein [Bacillota bacterium]
MNLSRIPYKQVEINDGFWKKRQEINKNITLKAIYDRFVETGRIASFAMDWREGQPNKPHVFYDSDVAKWIEGAAYVLAKGENFYLSENAETLITQIEKGQAKDGYFNTYFQCIEPSRRFCDRAAHELYSAGHLIEAAVAYFEAVGDGRFLRVAERYANLLEKVFKLEQSANFATAGHEEITLALVRLYETTDNMRYLELSRFFIEERGINDKDVTPLYDFADEKYAQDHMPVRKQRTAEGHAVRATYMYTSMADLARLYCDAGLKETCEAIWENITNKRMYVTGGIGSAFPGENFTYDYDLPNFMAYAETCAGIGLFFFAHAMMLIKPKSCYADIAELVLYNAVLAGISLSGDAFFYENPLEMRPDSVDYYNRRTGGVHLPIYERKKVFECSCCPPNIARLIGRIGDYLYTNEEDTIYMHHYINSSTNITLFDQIVVVTQKTEYPFYGNIKVSFELSMPLEFTVAFRIPEWAEYRTITVCDKVVDKLEIRDGYAFIRKVWKKEDYIEIDFPMSVVEIEANPNIWESCGKVSLKRGPIMYCIEEVDAGKNLSDVVLPANAQYKWIKEHKEFTGVPCIKTKALRRPSFDSLYKKGASAAEQVTVTAIPYYAWANRGKGEMIVWIQKNFSERQEGEALMRDEHQGTHEGGATLPKV